MRKRVSTATDYAKQLYMADRCNGHVAAYSDHTIIDTRVRAFVDGVAWAKRQAYKRRKAAKCAHNG